MTRPVDRTRTEESHRGSGVFRLAQTCQGGDLTDSNSLRGESVVPDLSKSQRKPLQLYYLIVRACKFHPDLIEFLSSKKKWNQEPKEDIFTRDNHQPKWIQMVYSQGHSTYHSSDNLTGRNNQLPHKKNNACHWGSSSQNIQNMVWTQHLFDTTSQIKPDMTRW